MNLIKELSKLRLPKINYYQLDYVPEDAEEVREFMRSSIQPMDQFWFNYNKQFQIEGSRYINELKDVAKKSRTRLYIYNTNFTSKEFCELISAAKNVQYLYLFYNLIPLDEECDFGTDMKKCKIGSINLSYSGSSNYSNWNQNPNRFENLIAAIAKCKPLTKSLTCLYINFCDFEKEKAQEILDKYKLKSLNVIS